MFHILMQEKNFIFKTEKDLFALREYRFLFQYDGVKSFFARCIKGVDTVSFDSVRLFKCKSRCSGYGHENIQECFSKIP